MDTGTVSGRSGCLRLDGALCIAFHVRRGRVVLGQGDMARAPFWPPRADYPRAVPCRDRGCAIPRPDGFPLGVVGSYLGRHAYRTARRVGRPARPDIHNFGAGRIIGIHRKAKMVRAGDPVCRHCVGVSGAAARARHASRSNRPIDPTERPADRKVEPRKACWTTRRTRSKR